jgi:hypothetical protein
MSRYPAIAMRAKEKLAVYLPLRHTCVHLNATRTVAPYDIP